VYTENCEGVLGCIGERYNVMMKYVILGCGFT
jgi:hypothetical protein